MLRDRTQPRDRARFRGRVGPCGSADLLVLLPCRTGSHPAAGHYRTHATRAGYSELSPANLKAHITTVLPRALLVYPGQVKARQHPWNERVNVRTFSILFLGILVLVQVSPAVAQDTMESHPAAAQSGHDMSHMQGAEGHAQAGMQQAQSFTEQLEQHTTAGTDAEPGSTPAAMWMASRNGWWFMLHGEAFLNGLQQSGPRGADKVFSTNWFMPMAQRKLGAGKVTFRAMFSLEPGTVTGRRYPELFQQGETAYGRAIVDGQHPHDFFMELAGMYDLPTGEHSLLSIYAGPRGDPAMGPVAYPHRASASEDPLAPLGHHLQDSTHIADNVVTLGWTYGKLRVEGSGFHGREPDEYRWGLNGGAIDSWSTRLTVNPAQNWSFQYSIAQLHSPEGLAPEIDVRRMTASLSYNRPIKNGNWASMLLWGRNQSLTDGNVGNGYLLESTLKFAKRNAAWTRLENVDRTTELLGEGAEATGFHDRFFTRVQAYTVGYDREIGHVPHLSTAVGGQVTWYGVPENLRAQYGAHPVGGLVFLRLRLQ